MIQLFHVSKMYPPNAAALRDINLQIDKGEFVFLTGPSGAGKTTLLKLLFRQEAPSEGQILINGQSLIQLNGRGVARLRRQMGLVFQEFKFLPYMTALDNVALAALVVGAPRKESYTKGYRLLCDLGLKEKCNAKPLALSGGEQQRIAIARALINDPMCSAGRRAHGKSRPSVRRRNDAPLAQDPGTGNHDADRQPQP